MQTRFAIPGHADYNANFVSDSRAYKVAAEMGSEYTALLEIRGSDCFAWWKYTVGSEQLSSLSRTNHLGIVEVISSHSESESSSNRSSHLRIA